MCGWGLESTGECGRPINTHIVPSGHYQHSHESLVAVDDEVAPKLLCLLLVPYQGLGGQVGQTAVLALQQTGQTPSQITSSTPFRIQTAKPIPS